MTLAALVLFVVALSPPPSDAALGVRLRTAAAIAKTDCAMDDTCEVLAVYAIEESGDFAPGVETCRVLGDRGLAHGLWQIHPRTADEVRAACVLPDAAQLALDRYRESERACAHLPRPLRGSGYCSGSCSNRAGQWLSARRWRRAVGE